MKRLASTPWSSSCRSTPIAAGNRNDITIVGYFVSIDSGSLTKRFVIGFGSGAPELATVVEVYVMSQQGLRRLASAELNSAGSKGPETALPLGSHCRGVR